MQGFKTVPPHTFSCTLIKAQPKTHTHARAWCGSLRDLPCFGWYSALHTRDTAITITKYKKKKKKSFSCMASSSRCVPITDYTTRHDISITRYRYRLNIFGSTIRTDSRFPPLKRVGFASIWAARGEHEISSAHGQTRPSFTYDVGLDLSFQTFKKCTFWEEFNVHVWTLNAKQDVFLFPPPISLYEL